MLTPCEALCRSQEPCTTCASAFNPHKKLVRKFLLSVLHQELREMKELAQGNRAMKYEKAEIEMQAVELQDLFQE